MIIIRTLFGNDELLATKDKIRNRMSLDLLIINVVEDKV
jgi:hypothetical protein